MRHSVARLGAAVTLSAVAVLAGGTAHASSLTPSHRDGTYLVKMQSTPQDGTYLVKMQATPAEGTYLVKMQSTPQDGTYLVKMR